jgi:serine protease Do
MRLMNRLAADCRPAMLASMGSLISLGLLRTPRMLRTLRALMLPFALTVLAAPSIAAAEIARANFIQLSSSVLKVEVRRAQGGYALGSGVVVRPGMLVTNCHVTRDAAEINVLRGGARWRVQSQALDVEHDLCVLHAPALVATAVEIGRDADVTIGQHVMALGYTGGLGIQNSAGDVVALHRHDNGRVLRVTNWFTSGASGGGLFDAQRRLIGILTYRLLGAEAHYFAAPVAWLHTLLDDATRFEPVKPQAADVQPYWQRPMALQPNFLRAAVMERDARWPELETLTAHWLRATTDDAEPWYLNGIALEQLNRLPEARASLERSVALEPTSGVGWYRLGLVYLRQGQRELAVAARTQLEQLKSGLATELAHAIARL